MNQVSAKGRRTKLPSNSVTQIHIREKKRDLNVSSKVVSSHTMYLHILLFIYIHIYVCVSIDIDIYVICVIKAYHIILDLDQSQPV